MCSLSCAAFGVFFGVLVNFVWFFESPIREFPVGEDSPTAIGFPLGLIVGSIIAWKIRDVVWSHLAMIVAGVG